MATASGSGSGSGPWKRSKNNKPGLISKIKGKIRVTKMDWTPENDNKLLLLGLGKELKPADYQTIADSYKERPSKKAVQERLAKLRAKQRTALTDLGLAEPSAEIEAAWTSEEAKAAAA
ncbi:hypothetical protein LTR09_008172 [Extremus antarcticus]|uniref:Uncharacterized protein n=1 Tax=Extremus antarcticus TaxID=702011 RepID=A0AAJ0GCI2_9PEZI|nr:hypothetical protein LTR09_008172 [Extremus antarcticus]